MTTSFDNKTVFVTGANRGIGEALIRALLANKGVKKIYAAARQTKNLPDFADKRVVPVQLDITDAGQVKKAVESAPDVQILINNAGALAFASIVEGKLEDLDHDMRINYLGTIRVVQGFVPVLEKNGGGGIASISSVVGLAPIAGIGGYSASKAALHSAIQSMRAELESKNISVHGIYPGPIDTDMAKDFDMQKTSAKETAENILAGIAAGRQEIFPDAMSVQVGTLYAQNPKALEQQFATM
ncbi:MAG: SDR family oxidoreductase [Alphaproteobacteria bacterium]|nr:SDR family oxidoreductase [Alphaproteobacteria bacterium]MBV8549158.1 SDR family oxidoreductase [Alphaproteobacteria bacterium]